MIISIIKSTYNSRNQNKNCPLHATAFIIPLILFFPIQQTGNFFGQWGNLFIWFSVGYAMSNNQKISLKVKSVKFFIYFIFITAYINFLYILFDFIRFYTK